MTDVIPAFEGHPVEKTAVKVTGSTLDEGVTSDMVLYMDDVVQVITHFRVVGVNHVADADGNLTRTQTLRPVEMTLMPFDPDDPNDIGVLRAPRNYTSSTKEIES